ncbi:MAG: ATPase domain-containing protein [Armatimonadota bacterium]|nr:hypothetical protein [bacterium]
MQKLKTYIESLDEILHGGIPEFAVTVITGEPGSGKTVLTLQTMFNNARHGAKCIYFTTLSEPAPKLIRYTQMFEFFDEDLINNNFKFADLGSALREGGPDQAMERLIEVVEAEQPDIVAIDSFKAIHDLVPDTESARLFVYDLAVQLSLWSVTTFLVGEYTPEEISHSPEFAVADAIINMGTETSELASLREIQIKKLRGSSFNSGKHFFEIGSAGVRIYPRVGTALNIESSTSGGRVSSGVPGLDELLHGGLPSQSATIIEGGTGIGKTLLGLHFMARGLSEGEKGIIFTFEETPDQLKAIAAHFGLSIGSGTDVEIQYTAPVELLGAKWLTLARDRVQELGAKRVMLDSVSTMAMGVTTERRFKDLIYTAVKMFRSMGVTFIMTMEAPELLGSSMLTGHGISSMSDNIIMMRYVEVESQLKRAISILKMRGTSHENDLREFKITNEGILIGEPFKHFQGVLSGLPTPAAQ